MGFPIRKSTGHRLFAPHRSLSQRTTSFIASCRQGIHRMLLGHLIALISNAHLRKAGPCEALCGRFRSFLLLLGMVNTAYRKTSLHRDRPKQSLRLASSYRTALASAYDAPHRMRYPMPSDDADCRPAFRAYPFFTMSRNPPLGSRQNCCLFEFGRFFRSRSGGARRDRTDDLLLAKQALSQLSYGPVSTSRPPSRRSREKIQPPSIGGPGKI